MGTILIVDDNENNLYLLRFVLEQHGHSVSEAKNGKEAVDMALASAYDLILMDIQMPGKDGVTATREIIQSRPEQEIIAVSAKVLARDRNAMEKAGCTDFLEKPIDIDKLVAVVSRCLSGN